jgi:hypothetical protein
MCQGKATLGLMRWHNGHPGMSSGGESLSFLQRPATETVLVIQGENEVVVDDGQADNNDWRRELMNYISNPGSTRDRKIQRQTLKYTIIEGILHRHTSEGLSLKCLSKEEAKITVGGVHEGMCGAHQDVHKMKWLLRRSGVYWSSMLVDCFKYAKGCEAYQQFGKLQIAPASMLHPIIKPWPFRGWSLDFIGEVHPASTKGHQFVLMAIDYFTKWAEAVPLKNMAHQELIRFVMEDIVYRFGIPQTLTTDQGPTFISQQFREFATSFGIKLLNSSPYYARANGQAEANNKIMISLIKKRLKRSLGDGM